MSQQEQPQQEQVQELSEILQVRREKLSELKAAGRDPYETTVYNKTQDSIDIQDHFDEYEGKDVSIAGRIISKRIMGKASFFHIMDGKGDRKSVV